MSLEAQLFTSNTACSAKRVARVGLPVPLMAPFAFCRFMLYSLALSIVSKF